MTQHTSIKTLSTHTTSATHSTGADGGSPLVALAAGATALTCAVVGVLQITHEPSSDTTVVGIEHAIIACLSLILVLQLPVLAWVTRHVPRRWPAFVAGSGMVSLALVAAQSNIQGHDASYFAAMALPANALWFFGLIAAAVTSVRRRSVPRTLGVLLPFTWVALIPLSSLGGGVLASAYFAAVAWHVITRRRSAERPSLRSTT